MSNDLALALFGALMWFLIFLPRMLSENKKPAVSGNSKQTGPMWEQDEPWVLDMEDDI